MATIPDAYFGRFKLDRSDNFEELLTAKGMNFMMRKVVKMLTISKILSKNEDGTFSMTTETPKGTKEIRFKLGEEVETETMDGKQHKVTFHWKDDRLHEDHWDIATDSESDKPYYTLEADELILIKKRISDHCDNVDSERKGAEEESGSKQDWGRENRPTSLSLIATMRSLVVLAPFLASALAVSVNQGCYTTGNLEANFERVTGLQNNAPDKCLEACQDKGRDYVFAALVRSSQCWCGTKSDYKRLRKSTAGGCKLRCPGAREHVCGGLRSASVYENFGEPGAGINFSVRVIKKKQP